MASARKKDSSTSYFGLKKQSADNHLPHNTLEGSCGISKHKNKIHIVYKYDGEFHLFSCSTISSISS